MWLGSVLYKRDEEYFSSSSLSLCRESSVCLFVRPSIQLWDTSFFVVFGTENIIDKHETGDKRMKLEHVLFSSLASLPKAKKKTRYVTNETFFKRNKKKRREKYE